MYFRPVFAINTAEQEVLPLSGLGRFYEDNNCRFTASALGFGVIFNGHSVFAVPEAGEFGEHFTPQPSSV